MAATSLRLIDRSSISDRSNFPRVFSLISFYNLRTASMFNPPIYFNARFFLWHLFLKYLYLNNICDFFGFYVIADDIIPFLRRVAFFFKLDSLVVRHPEDLSTRSLRRGNDDIEMSTRHDHSCRARSVWKNGNVRHQQMQLVRFSDDRGGRADESHMHLAAISAGMCQWNSLIPHRWMPIERRHTVFKFIENYCPVNALIVLFDLGEKWRN